jgi:hypothetical protein
MRIYSERNLANHLLAPPGLGDFLVLYLGTGVDEPTPAIASALDIDATADRS